MEVSPFAEDVSGVRRKLFTDLRQKKVQLPFWLVHGTYHARIVKLYSRISHPKEQHSPFASNERGNCRESAHSKVKYKRKKLVSL